MCASAIIALKSTYELVTECNACQARMYYLEYQKCTAICGESFWYEISLDLPTLACQQPFYSCIAYLQVSIARKSRSEVLPHGLLSSIYINVSMKGKKVDKEHISFCPNSMIRTSFFVFNFNFNFLNLVVFLVGFFLAPEFGR